MKKFDRLKFAAAAAAIVAVFSFLSFNAEQYKDDFINVNRATVFRVWNMAHNGGGTGFTVKAPSGKTYLMTNGHVCGLADNEGRLMLQGTDGTFYTSHVKELYKYHDLCLVNAKQEWPALKVASSASRGEDIYILGHPGLEPLSLVKGQINDNLTISIEIGRNMECEGEGLEKVDAGPLGEMFGISSICVRTLDSQPVTANIYPGNSGSPVFNKYGNVAGVAFASNEYSRGYIVPLQYVKSFLEGK